MRCKKCKCEDFEYSLRDHLHELDGQIGCCHDDLENAMNRLYQMELKVKSMYDTIKNNEIGMHYRPDDTYPDNFKSEYVTVLEAARLLQVSEEHCRRLLRKKIIRGYREGRRGGWRVPKKEIEGYQTNKYKEKRK